MMQSGLIASVEDKPPTYEPPKKTYIPLDRFLASIAKAPLGAGIDRATFGMNVDDEPPMAAPRSPDA